MSWGIAFAFFIGCTAGFIAAGFMIGAARQNERYDADNDPERVL